MAENLKKKPSRGILKNSSSFDIHDSKKASKKSSKGGAKWDEMNIMATLHPPDKDYGHMKIDEPKTPYNFEGLEDVNTDMIDAAELAERIRQGALTQPRALQNDESEEEDDMTPEEKQSKRDFEMKRKKHYNEYYAMKLARKLLEKDEDEEDNEDNPTTSDSPNRDADTKP